MTVLTVTGAIYSLFQILEGHTEQIASKDWIIILESVLIRLFSNNERSFAAATNDSPTDTTMLSNWNESAILLLENLSTFLNSRLDVLLANKDFEKVWGSLISHIKTLIERKSLTVSASVFTSLEKVFSANDADGLERLAGPVWSLWLHGNPARHQNSTRKIVDNQPALMAYLSCFLTISQLGQADHDAERVRSILRQVELCATESSPTAYAGDVDSNTPLQSEVLECIKLIHRRTPESFSLSLQSLAFFITLPFDNKLSSGRKGPTFVALSKNSMDLIENLSTSSDSSLEVMQANVLEMIIRSLAKPISLKYAWKLEGNAPSPWRKATSALLNILSSVLPQFKDNAVSDAELESIWNEVLTFFTAVISTGIEINTTTRITSEDLDFDITSTEAIYDLAVPALGAVKLSDELRRTFAHILYEHSLIHEPHPEDLPVSYKEPLSALHKEHIGRTNDLPPSPRARMSYTNLELL